MFNHSIKVPRLYKIAAKLAKDSSDGLGSVKQLVYECKHNNLKALYSLAIETLKHAEEIDTLLKKSKLFVKEPRFDPWLAKILITELIWGKKKLSGECKPIKTILAYEQIFKAHISDAPPQFDNNEQVPVEKPRYVRVNTLQITVNEVIDAFRDDDWTFTRNSDDSYNTFLEKISSLNPGEFTIDVHIPYLLIFPPKTQFYNHYLYRNGSIILQDKASCLPVHILNPLPGSKVLDMCAAPGMKTTQCASLINNDGEVIAVEFDQKRFQTLNKMIENAGTTCVRTINRDVITITEKDCPGIDYILVDPSCSGSGIVDRVEITKREKDAARLGKLAGFQIKILRHALNRFSNSKRVVYSTCSLYPEENEDVVRQVLETSPNFKLVDAKEFVGNNWINFGSPDFGGIGELCLYAKPEDDLTNGFFVAVFERIQDGEKNEFLNRQIFRFEKKIVREGNKKAELGEVQNVAFKKRNRRKQNNQDPIIEIKDTEIASTEKNSESVEKIKKKKKSKLEALIPTEEIPELESTNQKKKKKKSKLEPPLIEENNVEADVQVEENIKHKKKKKHKTDNELNDEETIKSKKKKKAVVETSSIEECPEIESKSHKKKKNKSNHEIEENNKTDNVENKKKKKRATNDGDPVEEKTTKLKKKKASEELDAPVSKKKSRSD